MKIFKIFAMVAFGVATAPLSGVAQDVGATGTFRDWSFFVVSTPKECLVVSTPTGWVATLDGKTVPAQRGNIRFYISVMPGDSGTGVPSFAAGYPLSPSGQVKVSIGDTDFIFLPNADVDPEFAWSQPDDDVRVVAAMKAGADATVIGHSARGKTTTDTFSLRGFTAAYNKAREMCP